MYYRLSSSVITVSVWLSVHPSILHFPPTCIDKFSWTLKFDIGFFNAFLLENYYIKIAF